MPIQTELMSVKQVADQLSMGKSTIRRLVKIKKFPSPIKVGGATRWRAADLEDWLASQEAIGI